MGFVAKKVFGLFDLLANFRLDLSFMLGPPTGNRIMRAFAFLFALLVFGGIHVGYAVHTVDDLDRPELHPAVSGNLHNLFQ